MRIDTREIFKKVFANILGVVSLILIYALFFFVMGLVFSSGFRNSLFASNPKEECEAYIDSGDSDTYCNEKGEKGSRSADAFVSCELKAPDYVWSERTDKCIQVKYESKEACIIAGKEETPIITEDGEAIYSKCQEDGTTKGISPDSYEYDDYPGSSGVSCQNVTSYDYNWDNDMLCTREDGSQFYTDYEGADYYQ